MTDKTVNQPFDRLLLPAHNWIAFLIRSILWIGLGVIAILYPISALFAFTFLFAIVAGVDGVASIIGAVKGAKEKTDRWGWLILRGLAGIAIAVIFVLMPLMMTVSYAFVAVAMISAWAILTGVMEIGAAIRLRKEIDSEWLMMLSGLISILFGMALIYIMYADPAATILSVGWLIGAFALCFGFMLGWLAFKLRKHRGERSDANIGNAGLHKDS